MTNKIIAVYGIGNCYHIAIYSINENEVFWQFVNIGSDKIERIRKSKLYNMDYFKAYGLRIHLNNCVTLI